MGAPTCGGQRRHAIDRAAVAVDVILTSNMFGDILSDEASQLSGSIGLLASARWRRARGMYEPITVPRGTSRGRGWQTHRHLPVLGDDAAHVLQPREEAAAVEAAVERALSGGHRTRDIAAGGAFVTCRQMTDFILAEL